MSWKKLILSILTCLVLVGAILWATASHQTQSLARPNSDLELSPSERGAAAFEGAGFGALSMTAMETHALPWRLVGAALVLEENAQNPNAAIASETLDVILARFGFLVDATPVNRPANLVRNNTDMALGFTYGDLAPIGGARLRVSNLGCAACHAGVTYNAEGQPQTDRAWLGMPNTSLDLEAYVNAIYVALSNHTDDVDRLLNAVQQVSPDLTWQELQTLRFMVLPIVADRMQELEAQGKPLPFPNGVPGSTNGVAALKFALGLPLRDGGLGETGIVSIPDLSSRIWRNNLLVDGAYAIPETGSDTIERGDIDNDHLHSLAAITSFFTVPSMGVQPEEAEEYLDDANDIFRFLNEAYAPQSFPGVVDIQASQRGASIYQTNCAECHGAYAWKEARPELTAFPNWAGDVGTDRLRLDVFTGELARIVSQSSYRDHIKARANGEYAAPPLGGIWASAPYLHNGSVPTLMALLNPQTRPESFQVGGHALDFVDVGILLNEDGSYPQHHDPFSIPVWIDTKVNGYGNQGHNFGSDLAVEEKRDLIEFLKLL